MINAVKSRYWSRTHNFGLKIIHSWDEAISIDRKTGTDYCRHVIENRMAAAGISLKFVNDRPLENTEINCHLVFDVKIDFNRKACYVAGGHLTDLSDNVPTYASVISRKLVRILFLISALYDIKVLAVDISNSFLNSQCAKKVF